MRELRSITRPFTVIERGRKLRREGEVEKQYINEDISEFKGLKEKS